MRVSTRMVLAVFLVVAVFISGCTGGGGSVTTDEQKIHNVLNQFESAMKSKNAEKLASLATYPAYLDGQLFEKKEQAVAYYNLGFAFITEIQEFKVVDREITITEDEAVVQAKLKSRVEALGEVFEDEQFFAMRLRKVGSTWKIVEA